MSAIWIEIIDTRGSTPRDVGTAMKVGADTTHGTIGGGTLEFEAIAVAKSLMARDIKDDVTRRIVLGPGLGQCCGGAVTLRFTRSERPIDTAGGHALAGQDAAQARALWLWGAGHVGRAVVQAAPPGAFHITWTDTDVARFPSRIPDNVRTVPAKDLPLLAKKAPAYAHHLILTYSHEIDFALCAVLLQQGAPSIGLIGSATKRARFFKRLRLLGLDPSSITCPIGDKALGKRPDQIAQGVVTMLMQKEAA